MAADAKSPTPIHSCAVADRRQGLFHAKHSAALRVDCADRFVLGAVWPRASNRANRNVAADPPTAGAFATVCVRRVGVFSDRGDCSVVVAIRPRREGRLDANGIIWSFAGGAVGAIGALGIILAMTFGGHPIYVMPLVFGGAPVVNAFLTIYMARQDQRNRAGVSGRLDHCRHWRRGCARFGAARNGACRQTGGWHAGGRGGSRCWVLDVDQPDALNCAYDRLLGRVWSGAAQGAGRHASQPDATAHLRGPGVFFHCGRRAEHDPCRVARTEHLRQLGHDLGTCRRRIRGRRGTGHHHGVQRGRPARYS